MIFLRLKSIFQRWSTNILYRSPTFSIKISETIVGFEKTSGSDWWNIYSVCQVLGGISFDLALSNTSWNYLYARGSRVADGAIR